MLLSWALAQSPGEAAEPPRWQEGPGYRFFKIQPNGSGKDGFTAVPSPESGVSFTNFLSERLVAANRVTENGSGVALGDVDGDGWCDIYFCRLEGDNALYRNLGDWRFEDITSRAGVACANQLSTGAVFADIDGDGDLDLLVNSLGEGTRAFLNDGAGKFQELTEGRFAKRFAATSMALGDIDRDGDLDVYVTNYRSIVFRDELPRLKVEARLVNGQIVVTPANRFAALRASPGKVEIFELPERDFLYLNGGNASFAPASWTSGNFLDESGRKLDAAPLDWGLSVLVRDLNDDGRPDIVTCNDFFRSPDRIWLQGDALRFQAISFNALRKVSLASMAVDVADINGDGLDDLFFAEMLSRDYGFRQMHRDNVVNARLNERMTEPFRREVPRNTLFLNNGDGTYAEIAELAGVDASEWSWGSIFLDVDLDGRPDLIIPTGHNHDVQHADILQQVRNRQVVDSIEERMINLHFFPKLETAILAFRNDGGLRFSEAHRDWGLDPLRGVANGLACADLDNDGDLDLVANRLNAGALLLRNESSRNRLAVRLKGLDGNSRGIGAKITVASGSLRQQQEMICGGRYLSGDEAIRTFAGHSNTTSITIRWPNTTETTYPNLPGNCVYEFRQSDQAPAVRRPRPAGTAPLFQDVSHLLAHRHVQHPFDDFGRQPLLRYNLATPGPGLGWFDINGDGREDLLIGGGEGGGLQVLTNQNNKFSFDTNKVNSRTLGIMAARAGPEATLIFSGLSNYETGNTRPPSVDIINLNSGKTQSLPGTPETTGALALADIDRDGDLDLFVAGRVMPGRYPVAADSRLYTNDHGAFAFDAAASEVLRAVGMVTAAQFTDINNDGWTDLVLACEWGPIRLFVNRQGRYEAAPMGLENILGNWTGIVTGDFDNDGLTDIIAGNWGLNTRYNRFIRDHPLRAYHGDLDKNGSYDCLEAIFNPALGKYVPVSGRETAIEAIPSLGERFPTFKSYAEAGIEDLAGDARFLSITTMASTCFLNRGDRFEAQPLPIEAQFSPTFGLAVADFDLDGNEDVILSQNLFDTSWELGRLDSGRPLLLRGDGRGRFTVAGPAESGLTAEGQGRSTAVADFDNDGRMDVAISQNGGETKLFRNAASAAGVRIRFRGRGDNPNAIGARYRIQWEKPGPVRELPCGGGWLSQNSIVRVIPASRNDRRISISWPEGGSSEALLPAAAREVLVSESSIEILK